MIWKAFVLEHGWLLSMAFVRAAQLPHRADAEDDNLWTRDFSVVSEEH